MSDSAIFMLAFVFLAAGITLVYLIEQLLLYIREKRREKRALKTIAETMRVMHNQNITVSTWLGGDRDV